jgi:hypothetical protein
MNIIYSDEPIEERLKLNIHSIFLAGPTPRSKDIYSWRPIAIDVLNYLQYDGQVIVPERKDKAEHIDYIGQVEWELFGLTHCKSIVFWVPRNMKTMPGLTTNVEFGKYASYSNTFYGRPDWAVKCIYLDWFYKKFNNKPIHNTLNTLLKEAII